MTPAPDVRARVMDALHDAVKRCPFGAATLYPDLGNHDARRVVDALVLAFTDEHRQSLTARGPATADVGRENQQLRNALIAMGRMIPGVMLADQVSSDFLGNLPDELAHYTLSRAAPSSGHAMAEGEAA